MIDEKIFDNQDQGSKLKKEDTSNRCIRLRRYQYLIVNMRPIQVHVFIWARCVSRSHTLMNILELTGVGTGHSLGRTIQTHIGFDHLHHYHGVDGVVFRKGKMTKSFSDYFTNNLIRRFPIKNDTLKNIYDETMTIVVGKESA